MMRDVEEKPKDAVVATVHLPAAEAREAAEAPADPDTRRADILPVAHELSPSQGRRLAKGGRLRGDGPHHSHPEVPLDSRALEGIVSPVFLRPLPASCRAQPAGERMRPTLGHFACASAFGKASTRQAGSSVQVSILAKSMFGRAFNSTTAGLAEVDADLQELLAKELDNSAKFVSCSSGEWDIQIEALLHEADDAGRMEALMLSALTFGLIPAWYDRELIMEVRASSRSGSSQEYTEKDSYTLIMWWPTAPFALFWNKHGAFRDIAKKQFGRVLAQLEVDKLLDTGARSDRLRAP